MEVKNYATVHIVSFSKIYNGPGIMPDEYCPKDEDMEKTYPGILSSLLRGDLIEDSDKSGYRSTGLWGWNGQRIIELDTDYDDYGSPPKEFKALKEFHPDYWRINIYNPDEPACKTISWSGEKQEAYWHSEFPPVSIDDRTLKLIESAKYSPGILIDIGDRKFIICKGHDNVDLIELPQFYHWHSAKYLTALDQKYNKDVWDYANKEFPNLRTISILENDH